MKKYTIALLGVIQFIMYIILIRYPNKWTLLLPFLTASLICLFFIINSKSKSISILLSLAILLLAIFYIYLIFYENVYR